MDGWTGIARIALAVGLVGVLCAGGSGAATAGEAVVWKRQIGTEGRDTAAGVTTDSAGNIYVAGSTQGSLGGPYKGGGSDAWLRKYDAAGRLLWKRQLGTAQGDGGRGVATDADGNVFLVGETYGSLAGPRPAKSQPFVAKYDSDGRLLWIRQMNVRANTNLRGTATDSAGAVYLVGSTNGFGGRNQGGRDAWVAKYDASGTSVWRRQLGTAGIDDANAVGTDREGFVYVVGNTNKSLGGESPGNMDAWLAKYDSEGRLVWTRQWGAPRGDVAWAVAADGAGNVYAAGETWGSFGGANKGTVDAWLVKFDSAGRLLWKRQPGTPSGDTATGLATDRAGDVYLTGWTGGALGGSSAGLSDVWLAKYDPSGGLLWKRQKGTSEDEFTAGVAADGAGNAYVTGSTWYGSFIGENQGGQDAFLLKFSPTD